jgi:hypothetical protein
LPLPCIYDSRLILLPESVIKYCVTVFCSNMIKNVKLWAEEEEEGLLFFF